MIGIHCRHCSVEHVYKPYTQIKKENGLFKPVKTGYLKTTLGAFCNNDGTAFIKEMNYCPSLFTPVEIPVVDTGEGERTQQWKIRGDVPTTRTPQIIKLGQQRLNL